MNDPVLFVCRNFHYPHDLLFLVATAPDRSMPNQHHLCLLVQTKKMCVQRLLESLDRRDVYLHEIVRTKPNSCHRLRHPVYLPWAAAAAAAPLLPLLILVAMVVMGAIVDVDNLQDGLLVNDSNEDRYCWFHPTNLIMMTVVNQHEIL